MWTRGVYIGPWGKRTWKFGKGTKTRILWSFRKSSSPRRLKRGPSIRHRIGVFIFTASICIKCLENIIDILPIYGHPFLTPKIIVVFVALSLRWITPLASLPDWWRLHGLFRTFSTFVFIEKVEPILASNTAEGTSLELTIGYLFNRCQWGIDVD